MKSTDYIVVVFYVVPTGVLIINTEPAIVGSVVFSYTMGLIAWWIENSNNSWIRLVF